MIDGFNELSNEIRDTDNYIISSDDSYQQHILNQYNNIEKLSEQLPSKNSSVFFLIEPINDMPIKQNKLLLEITANHHKTQKGAKSIGVCFNTNAIDNLIKVIDLNPPIINKLFINPAVLDELSNNFI